MPQPEIPARPAPYTGGINQTYPGSAQSPSSTRLPLLPSGTEGKGFARGWLRPILNMLKPSGGRSAVLRTDDQLQRGPAPLGITRISTAKIGGFAGPSQGGQVPGLTGGVPWETSHIYIPHQDSGIAVSKGGAGKAISNPARKFDDNVQVSPIYAGNQRGAS